MMFQYLKSESNAAKKIIFFHGYGASAEDLFSLSREMNVPAQFIFPQGPLNVPIGPQMTGHAWFPIDVQAHEQALRTGIEIDYSQKSTKPLQPLLEKLKSWLREMEISSSSLILGGFSQGAMLAAELALALDDPPQGLVLFSSTLLDQSHLEAGFRQRKTIRVFQSHGRMDTVLPFSKAERLADVFREAGVQLEFHEFAGGHEIPRRMIDQATRFIQRLS